jgi:glycine/D-amino acid oxidase-like deaminating enzyme
VAAPSGFVPLWPVPKRALALVSWTVAPGVRAGPVYETLAHQNALTDLGFEGLILWSQILAKMSVEAQGPTTFIARHAQEMDALTALAADPRAQMTRTPVPEGMSGEAAWRCDVDRAIEPRFMLGRLKLACAQHGVSLIEGSVTSLATGRATLSDGRCLSADHIIIATGQGLGNLATSVPELGLITGVKGQLFAVSADPTAPLSGIVRSGRIYLLPREGRVVVGATSSPHDTDATAVDVMALRELYDEACQLWPPLARQNIVESWSGVRPHTPEGLPMIGQSRINQVWLACGTYRNGWLFAPAIAALLVAAIKGGDSVQDQLQPFSPQRFPI